jgi:hypothetical protein
LWVEVVKMRNTQTGETGVLVEEGPSSRFNFMLYVDRPEGAPHELGYWAAYEWVREGWVTVEEREPVVLIRGGARKHQSGTREFAQAGFRFPLRPCPPRELGQR